MWFTIPIHKYYCVFPYRGEPKWEFSHIPLKVKTLDQLVSISIEWMNLSNNTLTIYTDDNNF